MEDRFGHDFGRVRVHTDERAARSAARLGAKAYSVGDHIVFARERFEPRSREGRRLLGHELTHVIQQHSRPWTGALTAGETGSAAEREASAIGDALVSTTAPLRPTAFAAPGVVQRQPEDVDESEATESEANDEVQDGDSPVIATPEPDEAEEPTVLAEAEPAATGDEDDRVFEARGGGAKKGKGTAAKKKKKPSYKKISRIDVDLSAQNMTITYADGSTEDRKISSGMGLPNTKDDPCATQQEKNCTPAGEFKAGQRGDANTKNSHGDRMAWYVALRGKTGPLGDAEDRGIGIHNSQPVRTGPASHGCIRVGDGPEAKEFAKKINKGVTPGVTVIKVAGKAPTKPWKKATKKAAAPKKKKP